jgi:hypothetical protein
MQCRDENYQADRPLSGDPLLAMTRDGNLQAEPHDEMRRDLVVFLGPNIQNGDL